MLRQWGWQMEDKELWVASDETESQQMPLQMFSAFLWQFRHNLTVDARAMAGDVLVHGLSNSAAGASTEVGWTRFGGGRAPGGSMLGWASAAAMAKAQRWEKAKAKRERESN